MPTGISRGALEACPPDPRPLTHDQRMHLSSSAGRVLHDPDETAWIGFSCLLEDARDASVAAALASLFDRHESLRCDYVPSSGLPRLPRPRLPSGVAQQVDEPFVRRVLPPGVVEFEPVPLGRQDTADAAHAVVNDHLAATANAAAWPYSGFVTVESEGRVTLYAAFDHVTFDGYSMYCAVGELPLLHRVFAGGDAPDPSLALSGSHLDHARDERDFARSLTPHEPLLAPWRDLLDDDGRVPGLPSASGVRRGDQWRHTVTSLPISTTAEAEGLREQSRSWGVSSGLSWIALLLRAIAAQEGPGPSKVRTLMSVHGRSTAHLGSMGWYAGVAPLTLDVDPAAGLRETALVASATWERSAPAGRIPMPLVGQLLETSVEPALVLSYLDSQRCPGWRDWGRNESRAFVGHVPRSDQMHVWINLLPTGTVLEARHPDTPECSRWVATLAVAMRRALLSSLDPRPVLVPAVWTPGD